ncbi:hypothetical protein O3G_MSEX009024 [Manduca sexta]|uniref:Uncharacterized protein n=1 Tax=Manduca sexta TaxID=7130 RepID=A0A921ZCQ5_MANSE|nr:hypothetical protein O3G_MSEX009024 [Manduca sexta]
MKFLGLFVFLIFVVASSIEDVIKDGKELSTIVGADEQGRGINSQRQMRGGIVLNLLCSDDRSVQKCPFLKAVCGTSASR